MADFQAIGGVSATLQTLLLDRMDFPTDLLPPGQSVAVTVDAPPHYEAEDGDAPAELPQVNLFLYRVTENAYLKNQELPGRGSPGAYGSPPLSLELFYILTAYGRSAEGADLGDSKLSHYLLGSAMRVFHDYPVVTEGLTRQTLPVIGDPILDARLFGEFEQLRLCLSPVSLDDLTKVWTALAQPYRLSAAYLVSATQIESQRLRRFPRPVGEPPDAGPRITVVTLPRLEIRELRVIREGAERAYPYARIGDTLVVIGGGFVGSGLRLGIGGLQVAVTPVGSGRIECVVPDAVLPDGTPIPSEQRLQPGPHGVRVIRPAGPAPLLEFSSNTAVFMLVPAITPPVVVDAPTSDPRLIRIRGTRVWHERLPGQTIVGRAVIPAAGYALASSTEVHVPMPDRLPRWPVACLLGGEASGFAGTTGSAELEVRIGGAGAFRPVSLAPMPTIDEAARLLGPALRAVDDADPRYANARATVARAGAGDAHVVVVPGGLRAAVEFRNHLADTLADDLRLSAAAAARDGFLSGELESFPMLTAAAPQMRIVIDGVSRTVAFPTRPVTLAAAAVDLQDAIRGAADGDLNFAATYVTVLGPQLLLLPGNGRPMAVHPVDSVDETTVRDLQLRGDYAVRVRVNGAESLEDEVITLP